MTTTLHPVHPHLTSVHPTIRSSDASLLNTCPTLYYLVRRLGLTPTLRQSDALTIGSWFHTTMQLSCEQLKLSLPDSHVTNLFAQIWAAREAELSTSCDSLGIIGESKKSVLHKERQLASMAQVFQRFALTLPLPNRDSPNTTLSHLLRNFKILDAEPRLLFVDRNGIHPEAQIPCRLVAQPDALLYHPTQHKIWIADWKTCAGSATTRLATCPHEFQTQHYLYVAKRLLPLLISHYGLHGGTTIAGVMHVAVQKCPLVFGTKDRPHHHTATSKRSKKTGVAIAKLGGWQLTISSTETGEVLSDNWIRYEDDAIALLSEGVGVKTEREYSGEPSHDRYVARCSTWYDARDEYQNLAVDRKPGDLINISYTHNFFSNPSIDRGYSDSYFAQLHDLMNSTFYPYSTVNFPRRADHLRQWGSLNPYFQFYEHNPSEWADIATRLSMTPNHRDGDILDATESCIIPTPLLSDPHTRADTGEAEAAEVEVDA